MYKISLLISHHVLGLPTLIMLILEEPNILVIEIELYKVNKSKVSNLAFNKQKEK